MHKIYQRYRRHRQGLSRGQSLVEFAIILPVVMLIVLIGLDFGRVYLGYVSLQQSARIAANFAALNPDAVWSNPADPFRVRYVDLVTRDAATINCTLPNPLPVPTFPDGTGLGQRAVVSFTCSFSLLTPFIGTFIGNPVNVAAEAQFPIRTGFVGGVPIGTAVPTAPPTAPPTSPPTAPPTATPGPTPSCTVPDFFNVLKNNARALWTQAGFASANISFLPGGGNYFIKTQTLIGGAINPPPAGCASTITVGP